MATTKNDWNIISQIYSKIFSTLILENEDRDYWTADGEEDTAIMPEGWDEEGSDTQTLGSIEWTKNVRIGLLNYVQTFQSRFYPVRGGDMEHNSLYPFIFLTFVEQGNDTLHSHPNMIENQTDLGIVIMQYNDGDVNLEGEIFWLDSMSYPFGYKVNPL